MCVLRCLRSFGVCHQARCSPHSNFTNKPIPRTKAKTRPVVRQFLSQLATIGAVGRRLARPRVKNRSFVTLCQGLGSTPYFSGNLSPKVPSRYSERRKVVKTEVNGNDSPPILLLSPINGTAGRGSRAG